jgi:hypothetical protein
VTWRRREAGERFAERRRNENEAPRLLSVVPQLLTLRFEMVERRSAGSLNETSHVRPIVVSNAPALFFFPCQNPTCKDGGHDLTSLICGFLRAGKEHFEGEDPCRGESGSADCGRTLRFRADATYKR